MECKKFNGNGKNRAWQLTYRHGTMKKRLSIHSNARCLLDRRISVEPHFKHTKVFQFPKIHSRHQLLALFSVYVMPLEKLKDPQHPHAFTGNHG
jgi:hypothetical protein